MPDPRHLRLFIAIELPGDILRALSGIQHTLQRDPTLARLRWVRPEGIHLTLKFLGDTPADRQPKIESAITASARESSRFTLALGSLGTFGRNNRPRVLWIDLDGDTDALARLQSTLEAELATVGFPKESRPFSPHLTLARVPDDRAGDVVSPLARALESVQPPSEHMSVASISLMRSELRPGGAVYTRLFDAPLR